MPLEGEWSPNFWLFTESWGIGRLESKESIQPCSCWGSLGAWGRLGCWRPLKQSKVSVSLESVVAVMVLEDGWTGLKQSVLERTWVYLIVPERAWVCRIHGTRPFQSGWNVQMYSDDAIHCFQSPTFSWRTKKVYRKREKQDLDTKPLSVWRPKSLFLWKLLTLHPNILHAVRAKSG